MAQKTQMVTIPLEEYKELLLKDKPQGGNDSTLIERFLSNIEQELKYTESTYYGGYIADNMKVEDGDKIIAEFMKMLKYTDFDRYMKIWNKVQTARRKDEDMKLKVEQMNKAKEIRSEEN